MNRHDRLRLLVVATHPVQYAAPVFRLLARHPRLDVQVAYCSLRGATPAVDADFGVEVAWDVPLLDGYPWVAVPNRSPRPGLGRFGGLLNPGLWRLVRRGGFDAVLLLTGYRYASFWVALAAAKLGRRAVLFGTDAHAFHARANRTGKATLKRWLWPRLFRMADVVVVPSSGGVALMRELGLSEERIRLTPYVVDNDWWLAQAATVDRARVRTRWGIPDGAGVVLFCGKLQPWKRPQDLLEGFARAGVADAYLVYAGEGPLRSALEKRAAELGVAERVRFLGFTNQSELPSVYRTADLLVLPSEYEPFGVVVNEAMLCGCPVAVSDRVGARFDLVRAGETGFIFPCGEVSALAALLREALSASERLRALGEAARARMASWSPRENIAAVAQAVEAAIARRRDPRTGRTP